MDGKILSIDNSGLGYVIVGSDLVAFTFDKIIRYRGEYPRELKSFSPRGLRRGVEVEIELDEKGRVSCVKPKK
jgi:hypothetical protein